MALKWYGPRVVKKVRRASVEAVNEVMEKAARHARNNHPGWRSITGRAEASIKVQEPAKQTATGVRGVWGSRGVPYMLKLEFREGRALIRAADAQYPNLAKEIRREFKRR